MVKLNISILPELPRQHRHSVYAIDETVFGLSPARNRLHDQALDHPELYLGIATNNKLHGYGLLLPLDNLAFTALPAGDIDEEELGQHIVSYDQAAGLYIASVASHPDSRVYESSRLVGMVIGSLLRLRKPWMGIAVNKTGHTIGIQAGMTPRPFLGHTFDHVGDGEKTVFEKRAA